MKTKLLTIFLVLPITLSGCATGEMWESEDIIDSVYFAFVFYLSSSSY